LDVREGEILNRDNDGQAWGNISYTVALSTAPQELVRVDIAKEGNDAEECNQYDDGLSLQQTKLEFGPLNWNISQRVWIDVVRESATIQGVSVVRFKHSVQSDDVVWAYPFLRPTRVTITDDDQCPAGSRRYDDEDQNVRKCGCAEGYYIGSTDVMFCDSVTSCTLCALGLACTFQQDIQTALLDPGMYRSTNMSNTVASCPIPQACKGDAPAGDDACEVGHEGPFCMVCSASEEETFVWSGDQCAVCDSEKQRSLVLLMVAVVSLLGGVGWYIVSTVKAQRKAGNGPRLSRARSLKAQFDRMKSGGDPFAKSQTKYKIVVAFTYVLLLFPASLFFAAVMMPSCTCRSCSLVCVFAFHLNYRQILSKVSTLYPMDLPENYSSYQDNANFFAFLDIQLVPFNCWVNVNFHDKLLIMTLAPIGFMVAVAVFFVASYSLLPRHGEERATKINKLKSKCMSVILIFLFSVFPVVSATIFQTFVFDSRLENEEYLKADYSIERSDALQSQYEAYAVMMGLLYCAGIPLGSFLVLRANKEPIQEIQHVEVRLARLRRNAQAADNADEVNDLEKEKSGLKKRHYMLVALSPLYRDYAPQYWFFEVPKFCCTVVLCGLITLLDARDSTQIFLALMVSLSLLLALSSCSPYVDNLDNFLAMSCQASLSLVMVVGLLQMGDPLFQDASFGNVLVVCVTFNWVLGIGSIALTFLRVVTDGSWIKKVMVRWSRHSHNVAPEPAPVASLPTAPEVSIDLEVENMLKKSDLRKLKEIVEKAELEIEKLMEAHKPPETTEHPPVVGPLETGDVDQQLVDSRRHSL
jgi:hypothetical protein